MKILEFRFDLNANHENIMCFLKENHENHENPQKSLREQRNS